MLCLLVYQTYFPKCVQRGRGGEGDDKVVGLMVVNWGTKLQIMVSSHTHRMGEGGWGYSMEDGEVVLKRETCKI